MFHRYISSDFHFPYVNNVTMLLIACINRVESRPTAGQLMLIKRLIFPASGAFYHFKRAAYLLSFGQLILLLVQFTSVASKTVISTKRAGHIRPDRIKRDLNTAVLGGILKCNKQIVFLIGGNKLAIKFELY